jgi:hypothetical protein
MITRSIRKDVVFNEPFVLKGSSISVGDLCMKWAGETVFGRIGAGTSLLFFENPYVEGQPARSLAAGDKVQIRLVADQKMISATIVNGEPDVTLELDDGTKWLITAHQRDELPTNLTWRGGPSQEWVVRDQLS